VGDQRTGQAQRLGCEGPDFKARRLTPISKTMARKFLRSRSLSMAAPLFMSAAAEKIRRTISESNEQSAGVEQAVWSIAWSGGEPKKIDAAIHLPSQQPARLPTLVMVNSGLRRSTQAQSPCKSSSAAKMASNNGRPMESSSLRVHPR